MSTKSSLKKTIGLAVGAAGAAATSLSFVSTAGAGPADGPAPDAADTSLQEVTVTGTRIRRVDTETANSVTVIDAKAIQNSGYQTVGDIIQRLPSVSGNGVSPAVNNGGGFGESTIDLRGLDAKRTLVLVDGRRQGIVGASDATDVNQIPVNMIDHIEILTEGAGAIYGSDAVGGVVNFITRKDTDGLEVNADYGKTTHADGAQHGFNVLFGKQIDNFHVEVGGAYFQQKGVYAGDRSYSKYALYLYGGTYGAYKGGSSRTPTGRIYLPVPNQYDCKSVTRNLAASGTSTADYRCFTDECRRGAAALRFAGRRRGHLEERHLQPLRHRLRRLDHRQPRCGVAPVGTGGSRAGGGHRHRGGERRSEGQARARRLDLRCELGLQHPHLLAEQQRLLLGQRVCSGARPLILVERRADLRHADRPHCKLHAL